MLFRDTFRRFDWLLFASVAVLLALGTMAIASVALSHEPFDWRNLTKHGIFIIVGFLILFVGASLDYRALSAWNRLTYVGGALLLLAVLFLGTIIRGTRGWFAVAGITWQPVEIAKFFFIIFLAKYFSEWARESDRIRHVLVSGVGAAVYVALIFLQPDVGSALLFFLVWFCMLLIAGIRKRHFFPLLIFCAILGAFAWSVVLKDYQRARIITFFSPDADPLGRGYNITQAKIAIGSGQWFGRGFGFGSQSQLKFLPEAETDFVFAVIAEELGFLGSALLLAAWFLLFWRLTVAIRRARDDFALFFLIAVFLLFFLEASVTIGMNLGLVPVTGLTLPFVSYGGSSLLSHFLLLAFVESIAVRSRITL